MNHKVSMTPMEKRAALSLAAIFSMRMLGLFMLLPVLALYAENLGNVTPTQVGLAIGIYGLTQALLQIPFGMLSDRVGRKPVIVGGLLIFAAGSVVAATAESMNGVIIGRALQGAGAIAAAVMALVADLTREDHRIKAMAMIGASIGTSFVIAMIAGPLLHGLIGVSGIFWVIAALAFVGILILLLVVPNPVKTSFHRDTEVEPEQFRHVVADRQLLRLDFGVLVLHLVLTATFVPLPLMLRDAGLGEAQHWHIYLPVMVLAMAAMVPLIIAAERRQMMRQLTLAAIAGLAIVEFALSQFQLDLWGIAVLLWLFFTAFNYLEASMPSWVAKLAPAEHKGTAMGAYSTSQFLGAFIGGAAGGWGYGHWGTEGVFIAGAVLFSLWWLAAIGLRQPRYLSNEMLPVGDVAGADTETLRAAIAAVPGVATVTLDTDDGIAYLKVDSRELDRDALFAYAKYDDNG